MGRILLLLLAAASVQGRERFQIYAKSGRRLMFAIFIDNAGMVSSTDDILEVFNDEGTIAAMLWKAN